MTRSVYCLIALGMILQIASCNDSKSAMDNDQDQSSVDSTKIQYDPSVDYYSRLQVHGDSSLSQDERDIYGAIGAFNDSEIVLVNGDVRFTPGADSLVDQDSSDQLDAARAYIEINAKKPRLFGYDMQIAPAYLYIDSATIAGMYPSSLDEQESIQLFWLAFHKRYPRSSGIYSFSRVGFNSDSTIGIVGEGYSCGGLCGHNSVVIVRHDGDSWVVWKYLRRTIS